MVGNMTVRSIETMSTTNMASSVTSRVHSTVLDGAAPVSIPRLPFVTERFQSSSARVHRHLSFGPLDSIARDTAGSSSAHRHIRRELKKKKFVVCSSNGDDNGNGAATKPQVKGEEEEGILKRKGTAVVWFKRDLRLDDHPGLMAAISYEKMLPLYVFDPVLLAGRSDELVKALWDAVHDLRKSLQAIGSDLVIRFGTTQNVLSAIAREVEALEIITEEEVELEWHHLVRSVSVSLSEEADEGKDPSIKQWRSSMYDIEGVQEFPDCYKKFQERKYPFAAPLEPPARLPSIPEIVDRGLWPSAEEILSAIENIKSEDLTWDKLKGAQEQDAQVLLGVRSPVEKLSNIIESQSPSVGALNVLAAWRAKYILASPHEALEKRRNENAPASKEGGQTGYVLKGGATGALNILKGYLRFLEPTGRDDWQEVHEHIVRLEIRPGASFRGIFGNALVLGTLSLRRIYHEAMDYEKARGGGWLSPFGFSSFTAAAVIRDSKAIEWYQLLALKSREQGQEQGFQVGTWRWRGFLIQYALAGTSGPPVVFVHGFGAFWQHWRDNIKSVAQSGHRVFALTMLGFGRSEKPLITYTELFWAELVRDFIVEVVREPVVIAGNSIGGYTSSVVAGLWPSLVNALVLLNSAGQVVPDYKSLKYNKPREKSPVAYLGSRLLLAYLQNLSNGMLTKCYPSNPSRADRWLQDEVMRASYDPNSTAVLEAMFHLRAPLPLNYYLDRYKGDILIIQGMRDPLHNSSKRASMLQAYCKNVSIQYVNAGHCPHDEVPEDVNSILTTWLKKRRLNAMHKSQAISAIENGNGSAEAKPDNEPVQSFSADKNGVVPDGLVRLIEEVEELV
ncbi:unnamed protein product [Calypogeia fissa]